MSIVKEILQPQTRSLPSGRWLYRLRVYESECGYQCVKFCKLRKHQDDATNCGDNNIQCNTRSKNIRNISNKTKSRVVMSNLLHFQNHFTKTPERAPSCPASLPSYASALQSNPHQAQFLTLLLAQAILPGQADAPLVLTPPTPSGITVLLSHPQKSHVSHFMHIASIEQIRNFKTGSSRLRPFRNHKRNQIQIVPRYM